MDDLITDIVHNFLLILIKRIKSRGSVPRAVSSEVSMAQVEGRGRWSKQPWHWSTSKTLAALPAFCYCAFTRLRPQAMSHLPKDNKSSFLKTTHLHLPLTVLTLKKAQLWMNISSSRKSTSLIPPGARKCLQFLLQPIGIGIRNPLSFFPKIPLTTNPEIIKESFIIFIHGFHLNLGLEKKNLVHV